MLSAKWESAKRDVGKIGIGEVGRHGKHILRSSVLGMVFRDILEYNIKRHYDTNHCKIYDKFVEKLREENFEELKINLSHQKKLFDNIRKENIYSVKYSYVTSRKIARTSKAFSDGEFINECIVSAVKVIYPKKKQAFMNISLIGNTIAQRIEEMANNLKQQLHEKTIFIYRVFDNFGITEELLDLIPMIDTTTGSDLYDCIKKYLNELEDWNKLE
ncbi:Hypothetical protein CINCED_3A015779 [Cinara cedri]|uniref:Uncharacterized protein n=1 Tax=Cinara cedri TaxID=506608 RepID=A0A5E4NBF5_9HEMI|nr:Hypothetical protein CINCED_3A015779 [Cinara cedri]